MKLEWKPIESAPYSRNILVWDLYDDTVKLAYKSSDYETWSACNSIYDVGDEPYTHWMHLPKPPQNETREE